MYLSIFPHPPTPPHNPAGLLAFIPFAFVEGNLKTWHAISVGNSPSRPSKTFGRTDCHFWDFWTDWLRRRDMTTSRRLWKGGQGKISKFAYKRGLWLHLPRAPGVVMTTSVLLGWWIFCFYGVGRWADYIHMEWLTQTCATTLVITIPSSQIQHHIPNITFQHQM